MQGGLELDKGAGVIDVRECSLCDNKFFTHKELKTHVTEHLEEIKDIDIEHLKSWHELFACNLCFFL